jgi:cyclohexanone monooxygenase
VVNEGNTDVNENDNAIIPESTTSCDAVVVGAGFGGLYMLYKLRELGLSVRGFEAGGGVGGTWYWNRYPGARCDLESLVYCYSFSQELAQEWEWTERFATQPEILRYLEHAADRFDLRRHIRFSTRVVSAAYEDATNQWRITTDDGGTVRARFCIMATGCLSEGRVPAIKGLQDFQGEWHHTGAWPKQPVDFAGKRVAVLGTGSTSIQLVPEVAKQAAHTFVFQRTASFSVPARNAPLAPETIREFKTRHAVNRELVRTGKLTGGGDTGLPEEARLPLAPSGLAASPELRQQAFEARWQRGGPFFMSTFPDQMVNREVNDAAADFIRAKIREIVEDPKIAELLSPFGYPVGAKRICVDTDYYATFNRDDVTLVNAAATPILEILPDGLRTSARDYAVDVIVFATGFDAFTGALSRIDISGRHDLKLREVWQDGPTAYLGLMTAGFPNLFFITGPGSPSVLSNVVVSIEQHVEWIANCLSHMRDQGLTVIEAAPAAEANWVEHVNQFANATLFPAANSWYIGANIPGKPRVFVPYAAGVGAYREICERVAAGGYEGFRMTAGPVVQS